MVWLGASRLGLLLLLAALACQLSEGEAAPTSPLQGAAPTAVAGASLPLDGTILADVAPVPPLPFASWEMPAVRDLPGRAASEPFPALDQLQNAADLWPLLESQRARLAAAGFVVQPPAERFFHDLYLDAAREGRPLFITTDAVIHGSWQVIAATWAEVEQGQLADDLAVLTTSMSEAAQRQYESAPRAAQPAAAQVTAFFAVAASLLDPGFPLPESVAGPVNEELILLRQASGAFSSPIFGYVQDYRRFQLAPDESPADGHAAYSLAAAWLSSMGWPLRGDSATARQHGLALLMLLTLLESSQNWSRWERIVATQAYFQGEPAGWTLASYAALARRLYDGQLPAPDALADRQRLDSFILSAQAAGATEARLLHFAPGSQWPDQPILSGLTFNRVGLYLGDPDAPPPSAATTPVGLIRAFPQALDVAAAFGSSEALRLLVAGGETAYEGYASQLEQVRVGRAAAGRTLTLRQAWLWALDPLFQPPASDTPLFKRAGPWRELQLAGWVGGWSEIRREREASQYVVIDPALLTPDAASMPAVAAYVDPEPALYAGLAATVAQVRDGLASRGLLAPAAGERLQALLLILGRLQQLAEKELAGLALRPDETRFLRQVVPALAALAPEVSEAAMIATLHLDQNSGQLWQIGLGEVQPLFVLVPSAGGYIVAAGGSYSLYGFARPAAAPVTTASWFVEERPPPLAWQQALVTP